MRVAVAHTDPEHPDAGLAAYHWGRIQDFENPVSGEVTSADHLTVAFLDRAREEYPEDAGYRVWVQRLLCPGCSLPPGEHAAACTAVADGAVKLSKANKSAEETIADADIRRAKEADDAASAEAEAAEAALSAAKKDKSTDPAQLQALAQSHKDAADFAGVTGSHLQGALLTKYDRGTKDRVIACIRLGVPVHWEETGQVKSSDLVEYAWHDIDEGALRVRADGGAADVPTIEAALDAGPAGAGKQSVDAKQGADSKTEA